jgi:serine/threonine protein kinase
MTNREQADAGTTGEDLTLTQQAEAPLQLVIADDNCRYFGRYRVERELGRGGMGVVVLAHDDELNIPVALKVLPDSVSGDAEGLSRFKSEVLRGMTLAHSGIVRVHTFERDAQHAAIVMEYVPGETLADAKARQQGNCFDCHEILPWIQQLCVALDYAHGEARVAHRDLKPRNIMLTPEGRVKIADFGLASLLSESLTRVATSPNAVGTPPYMSPQQALGKPATRVDDIYALGATIYDLMTGRPPFFRGDVFAQVLHEEAPSMAQRRQELGVNDKADIPRTWERAVAACLSKEPNVRPASGAALLAMLHEVEMAPVATIRVKIPEHRSPSKVAVQEANLSVRIDDTESRARSVAAAIPDQQEIRILPPRLRLFRTQRTGAMKFVSNLVSVIVLAAIAALGMQVIKRMQSAKTTAAVASTAETSGTTGRLGSSALDSGRKLQTSRLNDSGPSADDSR